MTANSPGLYAGRDFRVNVVRSAGQSPGRLNLMSASINYYRRVRITNADSPFRPDLHRSRLLCAIFSVYATMPNHQYLENQICTPLSSY
jgi:hypothetical protein